MTRIGDVDYYVAEDMVMLINMLQRIGDVDYYVAEDWWCWLLLCCRGLVMIIIMLQRISDVDYYVAEDWWCWLLLCYRGLVMLIIMLQRIGDVDYYVAKDWWCWLLCCRGHGCEGLCWTCDLHGTQACAWMLDPPDHLNSGLLLQHRTLQRRLQEQPSYFLAANCNGILCNQLSNAFSINLDKKITESILCEIILLSMNSKLFQYYYNSSPFRRRITF